MQNMQRYFGFKVTINDDLSPADEAILRAQAKKIVDAESLDLDRYQVYLHQLILSAEETHFGVSGGVPGRLQSLKISFNVNLKQRKTKEIQFFNHVIDTTVPRTVKPSFSPNKIGYEIPSEYFSRTSWFQNAIIAFVSRELKYDRRKIKVQVRATPTSEFRSVLHDVTKAQSETHLDLRFQKDVQLRLPLGDIETMTEEVRMSDKDRGDTFIVNGGTVYGFGKSVSIGDIITDARTVTGLREIATAAEAAGEREEAQILIQAANAATEGNTSKAIEYLGRVGRWTLETVNRLGHTAAETAIKAAIKAQFPG